MNIRQSNIATPDQPIRVVIIGGGIAGLSTAWYLQHEAIKHNLNLEYTIIEQSNRWGGKIQTEEVSGFGDAPFIVEAGPDAFLTRKAGVVNLTHELGLDDRIQSVNSAKSRTYVVNKGKLTPLPDGMPLLVPTRLMPFLWSPLFSIWGKLRVGLDWLIPPRRTQNDETLASFVRRRLGAEILDKLAEPLLSGVYNAEPESQSMLATFPQFPALERQYGSLIRGALAGRVKHTTKTEPAFISFKTGTHELIDTLTSQLIGKLRLNSSVESVTKAEQGYIVALENGEQLAADVVILATPAKAAAELLKSAAPKVASQLQSFRYSSIGAVYLAFRQADVVHPLNGFGMVIPSREHRRIDGMTWVTSKWDSRAPSGHVMLRVFFGGPKTRDMMALDDNALVEVIYAEVESLLGIQAEPVFHRIIRWPEGYPQYDVGHLERVSAIELNLPKGVYITGSSYRGIGVPDCVQQGKNTVQQVMVDLAKRYTGSNLTSAEGAYSF